MSGSLIFFTTHSLGSNWVEFLMTQVWMADVLPEPSQVYFKVAPRLSLTVNLYDKHVQPLLKGKS